MLTASPSERIGWIQEALTLTRQADPRTRLDVLRGAQRSHIRFTDGTTELGVAEELLQLAVALRSPESESEARQWRANALLELGRGADYEHEVAASRERAMVVRAPQVAWVAGALHVGHLFLAGSLEECERAARDTGKAGQDLMGIGGFLYMTTQLFQVGLEGTEDEAQRILCEVAAGGERVLALAPGFQALMLMVARARMYCGQSDAAEDYLARVTSAHYVQPDPLDRNFLPAMVCAADLACSRNDVAAAAVVSSLLGAWKGWHAVAALGSAYLGPVSYWLGRLSLVDNRREDARRQLELARQESQRAGSVIYRAWSDYYLAHALPASEAALSGSLLESARSAAQRFSLGRLQTVLGA